MAETNTQVLLASRPVGAPTAQNFDIVQTPIAAVAPGEILVRTIYLSIDPYMRGRMDDAKSYAASVAIGAVMTGGVVGQVVQSRNANFSEGDYVLGMFGWQSFSISDGTMVRKLDPATAPISTAVGVLGMPGLTAYVGLLDIGEPKSGDTVVVSAASGAVGSVVGQIAKIRGCRVVGVAGPVEKCTYVEKELGFDVCVSHRSATLKQDLAAACPDGIDVYFENVGGKVFEAVLPLLNDFGRIPVCGLIANYNLTELPPGPDMSARVMRNILTKRLKIQGFIVTDRYDRFPAFERDVGGWIRDGSLKYREDIVDGLENAPDALIGVLAGRNFGKMLVRVSEDPTRLS